MLDLPLNADPTRHLRGHSPPPRPGDKTAHSSSRPVTANESIKRRRGKSPINAITVEDEDEEVDEMDDSDSEDGSVQIDIDEEDEDGIEETFPSGIAGIDRAVKERVLSISEDEDARPYGVEPPTNGDSRYAMGKSQGGPSRKSKKPDATTTHAEDSSDESVIAISKIPSPPRTKRPKKNKRKDKANEDVVTRKNGNSLEMVQGKTPNGKKAASGADVKARKDFWAAKGLSGVGSDSGDEFADGTDYVGLE
jgi:hypothetical protein